MKITDVSLWEAFYGVAKAGNFSKAASLLQLTLPQVSKRVAQLEELLEVRLFQRSTRVVRLTEEGQALYPKVTALLEDLRGVEESFNDRTELSGTLRLTSIPFLGQAVLIPLIDEFMRAHPKVRVELDLSPDRVNIVEQNIDLALRIEHNPSDSDLVYRKIAENKMRLVAAPAYLKRNKSPLKTIDDLHNHSLLMMSVLNECAFEGTRRKLKEFSASRKIICENGEFLTELALRGFGVIARAARSVDPYIRAGKLVEVLPKFPLETRGNMYVVVPSRRLLAPRVRAFMDLILKRAEEGID